MSDANILSTSARKKRCELNAKQRFLILSIIHNSLDELLLNRFFFRLNLANEKTLIKVSVK